MKKTIFKCFTQPSLSKLINVHWKVLFDYRFCTFYEIYVNFDNLINALKDFRAAKSVKLVLIIEKISRRYFIFFKSFTQHDLFMKKFIINQKMSIVKHTQSSLTKSILITENCSCSSDNIWMINNEISIMNNTRYVSSVIQHLKSLEMLNTAFLKIFWKESWVIQMI